MRALVAHSRDDADLRGIWVLKGEPALVDSTSPRLGEKVTYYSAICLETGEVEDCEQRVRCYPVTVRGDEVLVGL